MANGTLLHKLRDYKSNSTTSPIRLVEIIKVTDGAPLSRYAWLITMYGRTDIQRLPNLTAHGIDRLRRDRKIILEGEPFSMRVRAADGSEHTILAQGLSLYNVSGK